MIDRCLLENVLDACCAECDDAHIAGMIDALSPLVGADVTGAQWCVSYRERLRIRHQLIRIRSSYDRHGLHEKVHTVELVLARLQV